MSESEEERLITESKAKLNCKSYMKLLNKYIVGSEYSVKNIGTKAKIQIFKNSLYLIVNFQIPHFPTKNDIFFETWFEDEEGEVVNPLNELDHRKQYHGKDDGLGYILCQTVMFRMLFAVERYRELKETKN